MSPLILRLILTRDLPGRFPINLGLLRKITVKRPLRYRCLCPAGSVKNALYEPVGMWLPEKFRLPGTSEYVQGVEVSVEYSGTIPDDFDIMDLPACKVMVFQGPPFEDEKFEEAITDLWQVMKDYDPQYYGFEWADDEGPRFQLAPLGERGYIEARPVRGLRS
jgi:AraC family transcriptional regulator